MLLTSLISCY